MDEVTQQVRAIEALLEGHTDRRDEGEILDLLERSAQLDALLSRLDFDRLIAAIDDRLAGPRNRTRLFALLTRERVAELSIVNRAELIAACSRGPTPQLQERAIFELLRATTGAELTRLKNLLDRGSDHRDLQHVVFRDIDDASLRAALLEHLEGEAANLPRTAVKVLSDIDDTFYANWKDKRFPAKTVYPGVRQLLRELDHGPHAQADEAGDVAFVTARPGDRPGVVERRTHASLRALGLEHATVLAGSFLHIHGSDAIAERKLENFKDYARLFGEYDFVFIGDSGQGDASFGAGMIAAEPERVRLVMIHDVVASDANTRAAWASKGVLFFDTYVGAAKLAFERGLIQREGVARVAAAAREDFAKIEFEDPAQRAARWAELEAELTTLDAGGACYARPAS